MDREEIEGALVAKQNERRALMDLVAINACRVVNADLDGEKATTDLQQEILADQLMNAIKLLRMSLLALAAHDSEKGPSLSEALHRLTVRAGSGTGDAIGMAGKNDLPTTASTGADGGTGAGVSGYLIRRHRGRRVQSGD